MLWLFVGAAAGVASRTQCFEAVLGAAKKVASVVSQEFDNSIFIFVMLRLHATYAYHSSSPYM